MCGGVLCLIINHLIALFITEYVSQRVAQLAYSRGWQKLLCLRFCSTLYIMIKYEYHCIFCQELVPYIATHLVVLVLPVVRATI